MRIGLIGCGRVGVTIFYILKKHNRIVGVYDTNTRRKGIAQEVLGIKENPNHRTLIEQSDAIFLATPDDDILTAYRKLRVHVSGIKYVFHFSGILPASVMNKKKGVHRASIHPFATFPELIVPPRRKHLHLSIEGDNSAIKAARVIFRSKYFTLRKISKKDKPLYHLIGVFSSNLLIGLLASIYDMAKKLGWQHEEIRHMIHPIIEETLSNVRSSGLLESLSGPLQRGDVTTIRRHLKTLQYDSVFEKLPPSGN